MPHDRSQRTCKKISSDRIFLVPGNPHRACENHGLMVAGALETVNEWSFGVHDEALLDEYEGYDVSSDIAEELADLFEKVG